MKIDSIKIILFLVLSLHSCVSFPGKRALSSKYKNPSNCGFFQFYRDGSFLYDLGLKSQEKCVDNKSMPNEMYRGNLGKYSFDDKASLTPFLSLASKQVGLFEIRFSEDMQTLFMKRHGSVSEERFDKTKIE